MKVYSLKKLPYSTQGHLYWAEFSHLSRYPLTCSAPYFTVYLTEYYLRLEHLEDL